MKFYVALFLSFMTALLVSSCQSTAPTASDMDRYYKEANRRAQDHIAELGQERAIGKITPEEYDITVAKVTAEIPQKAAEMAWTRHELAESEMRANGEPTGDHPVFMAAPALGGVDGSLFRAPGDPTANTSNPIYTPPTTGYSPGAFATAASMGALGAR